MSWHVITFLTIIMNHVYFWINIKIIVKTIKKCSAFSDCTLTTVTEHSLSKSADFRDVNDSLINHCEEFNQLTTYEQTMGPIERSKGHGLKSMLQVPSMAQGLL